MNFIKKNYKWLRPIEMLLVLTALFFSVYSRTFNLVSGILLTAIIFLIIIKLKLSFSISKNSLIKHIIALVSAVWIFMLAENVLLSFILVPIYALNDIVKVTDFIISLFVAENIVCYFIVDDFKDILKKRHICTALCIAVLFFILYIYIPLETFISNNVDFSLTFSMVLPVLMKCFLFPTAVAAFFSLLLNERGCNAVKTVFTGLIIAVYAQYMFMNGNLGIMEGSAVEWDNYKLFSVFNAVVWLALILLPFIVYLFSKKIWKKIIVIIPAAMGGLHLLSLLILLITAPESVYSNSLCYMDGNEQFTVSSNKNIILFTIDAMDQKFLDEVFETEPEKMDSFKDFTVYTNACSVYDSTSPSMTQMYTNVGFDNTKTAAEWYKEAWNSDKANTFYDTFHNAGYKVLAYNTGGIIENFYGKFDNCVKVESKADIKEQINVDKQAVENGFKKLVKYRAYPFYLKRYADAEIVGIELFGTVKYKDIGSTMYQNKDFLSALNLKSNPEDKNFLIYQHISGTHAPNDNIETANLCINIAEKYINETKELGVYDNATIIFTADHGMHNSGHPENASAPIFMIKEAGVHRDSIAFNNSPIYHRDILSTLLVNAGLYDDSAAELFGPSIYDFNEDSIRERIWYDRAVNKDYPPVPLANSITYTSNYNVYYSYRFTGNTDELRRMAKDGEITEIYPMKELIG